MSDYETNAMSALRVSVRIQQLFLSAKLFQPIVVEIDKKRFMWDGIKNFHVEDGGKWNPLISAGELPDARLADLAIFLHCIDQFYEAAKKKRDSISTILGEGTTMAETFLLQNAHPYGGSDEEHGQEDQD
tara:strand:+ start:809 stop:1198 length:390 start_codon:yes stop_codon:yes gene_type:complete